MTLSYTFLKNFQYLCFRSQLSVQEALEGTDDCILWMFQIAPVSMFLRAKESISDIFWDTLFGRPRKSGSTSGTGGILKFWWLYLMNFWNFTSIYVFEVKESISGIPTELPCLSDLKNLGQLPAQEVLMILLSNVWNFSNPYVFEVQELIHC